MAIARLLSTVALGLALVVGGSNFVKPDVSLQHIVPAFDYLAAWFVLVGFSYLFFGIETRGRSIGEIGQNLALNRRPSVGSAPDSSLDRV